VNAAHSGDIIPFGGALLELGRVEFIGLRLWQ
jgi:hypothetical protein